MTENQAAAAAAVAAPRDPNKALAASIKSKIKPLPSPKCSIFRVPKKLRTVKEEAYVPEIVSIGPLHNNGNPNFQVMEEHKRWYLDALVSRSSSSPETTQSTLEGLVKSIREIEPLCREFYAEPPPLRSSSSPETTQSTLKGLVKSIREIEPFCREFYAEPPPPPPPPLEFTPDEFIEIMLLDGCFLLELLHRNNSNNASNNNNTGNTGNSSNNNNNNNTDPIFRIAWMIFSIQHDLILFENQIPFLVLERLFSLTTKDTEQHKEGQRPSLNELVLEFFAAMIPTIGENQKETNSSANETTTHTTTKTTTKSSTQRQGQGLGLGGQPPKHLLDLLRNQLLPSKQQTEDAGRSSIWEFSHCVTDLWEAGVTFTRNTAADGLLDIKFKDGIFEIPPFRFDESTDVLLRNLVAMEQCDGNSTSQITSYVLLLDNLINSERDVRLLSHKKIVHSYLADNQEMAVFVNSICKGVSINKFHYDGVCNRANEYFNQDWHKWRATLKRDYFNTPWAVLSFAAAVILLLLTFIQALFAGLSYNPSSSTGGKYN